MPLIIFPDVPDMLGVPNVPRSPAELLAGAISDLSRVSTIVNGVANSATLAADLNSANAVINSYPKTNYTTISLGQANSVIAKAKQNSNAILWGIFETVSGNLLGASSSASASLSFYGMDFVKEFRISDFPTEQGGFTSFNKVEMPATPKVTLVLSGSTDDRKAFLAAVKAASGSMTMYTVTTPEAIYENYSIERYSYPRSPDKGANLMIVDIHLKEIRGVTASYAVAVLGGINSPQSPDASSQVDNGIVQSLEPSSSLSSTVTNTLGGGS